MTSIAAERRRAEAAENTFVVSPPLKQRFPVSAAKDIIRSVFKEKLGQAKYSTELTKEVTDTIKNRLKDLGLPRYKYVVQVFIGENKGAGIRIGTRALIDNASDGAASEHFITEQLFAVCIAYGVYLY